MNYITCPFCEKEFETEFNWTLEDVECPGCKKIIDLELDGDTETNFYFRPSEGQGGVSNEQR